MRLLFILIVTLVIFQYIFIDMHERGHAAISISHGCVDYELENNFFSGSFTCLEHSHNYTDIFLQERMVHGFHEVVGYHLYIFLLILIFLVFVYMFNKNSLKK